MIDVKNVARTSEGMRELLFGQMDRLRKGETTPAECKSIIGLCDQIVKTVHMDLELAKFCAHFPEERDQVPSPALLGSSE
jgi:hypothetical protein